MTELEKVEKLREKAGVSYTEAKEALDKSGGDLLDALIYLESQGKASTPPGGGFYSGAGGRGGELQPLPKQSRKRHEHESESFADMLRRFGRFCLKMLRKGNSNFLRATKDGEHLFSCPVTALVLLLLFFFWFTLPVYIITLFFGVRYRFCGPDLERDSFNNVMESASDMADDVKKSFSDEDEEKV